MGLTGLARWQNAPTDGLDSIAKNIVENHQGQYRGKWYLTIKNYRSTLGSIPGIQMPLERSMTAVTVNDNVFALLEDPIQPGPFDVLQQPDEAAVLNPSHYRQTYVTLSPPGALEQLLSHLKARWVTARNSQTASSSQSQPRASQGAAGGNQLTVEGYIYAVGTDWIVRAGNVTQVGGTLRGMLLEAEYLPLPVDIPSGSQGTPELLSNFITSMIPLVPDARIHAVTIGDAQWEEVLYNQEEAQAQGEHTEPPEDDVFCFGDDDRPVHRKGDWVGIDRDRRSAYAIVGGLRMEGLL